MWPLSTVRQRQEQKAIRDGITATQWFFPMHKPCPWSLRPTGLPLYFLQWRRSLISQISTSYTEFIGAKNPHFLEVLGNNLYSEFQLSILNLKAQRTLMSSKSWLELWRTLKVPDRRFGSWSWWRWVTNIPNYLYAKFQLSILGLLRTLEVPDWVFGSLIW